MHEPVHPTKQVSLLLVGQVVDRKAGDDRFELRRRLDGAVVGISVGELVGPFREPRSGRVQKLLGEIDERKPGVGEDIEYVLREQAGSRAQVQDVKGAVGLQRDQARGRGEELAIAWQRLPHPAVVVVDGRVECIPDIHPGMVFAQETARRRTDAYSWGVPGWIEAGA